MIKHRYMDMTKKKTIQIDPMIYVSLS